MNKACLFVSILVLWIDLEGKKRKERDFCCLPFAGNVTPSPNKEKEMDHLGTYLWIMEGYC